MNILAFDLGGSGGQLFLGRYDGKKLSIESISQIANSPVPIGAGLYWNAVGCYQALLRGLERAGAEGNITSLGIDAFCNDFALVGGESELLTPVRCYRDDRTVRHADFVYDRFSPEALYTLTGNQTARFNTLMQLGAMRAVGLGWLLENAGHFLFLPDLFNYCLTGEIRTEYTLASVSQMFSFDKMDWLDELLSLGGLRREQLGPVAMPGDIVGSVRAGIGKERGVKGMKVVSVCEHDTGSAFLASPFPGGEQAILSSGTWAILGCTLAAPLITEAGFTHNFANEGGYPGYHRFLRNVMGLWIVQQIREDYRLRGESYSFAELEAAAASARPLPFILDVDDPAFFDPSNMPEKIHRHCLEHHGQAPETVGEMMRCVYEGLAMKYRWNLELLEQITGKKFPFISVLGGGCQSATMCQMTANACGIRVAAGPQEATALGNMLVQLIAAGEIASVDEGRQLLASSFPVQWYEPQDAAAWEERYRAWRQSL